MALLLVNEPGGSGTFYYAVLAIDDDGAYHATNAIFLGDRIAPENIEYRDGHFVYNYAVRKAGQPMTAQPSVSKSLWVKFDRKTGEIGEWAGNFEGEVDKERMPLGTKLPDPE